MVAKEFIAQLANTLSERMSDHLYQIVDSKINAGIDEYLQRGCIEVDLSEELSINAQSYLIKSLDAIGIPHDVSSKIPENTKEKLYVCLQSEGWKPQFLNGDNYTKVKVQLPFSYKI